MGALARVMGVWAGKLTCVSVDPSGGMLTYVVGWLIHMNGVLTQVIGVGLGGGGIDASGRGWPQRRGY